MEQKKGKDTRYNPRQIITKTYGENTNSLCELSKVKASQDRKFYKENLTAVR